MKEIKEDAPGMLDTKRYDCLSGAFALVWKRKQERSSVGIKKLKHILLLCMTGVQPRALGDNYFPIFFFT